MEMLRGAKNVTVEFQVSYDTEPPTTKRTSYKKVLFDLSWPNGPGNTPGVETKVVDEREF